MQKSGLYFAVYTCNSRVLGFSFLLGHKPVECEINAARCISSGRSIIRLPRRCLCFCCRRLFAVVGIHGPLVLFHLPLTESSDAMPFC